MKRFSSREFALLCAPILLLAGVGFLVSRRKPPAFDDSRLHLRFHIEKPTTLEAFRGVDAALITELHGPDTEPGKSQFYSWQTDAFLRVETPRDVQKSRNNNATGIWRDVWKGSLNNTRWSINTRPIPAGKLRFGIDAILSSISSASTTQPPRVTGLWRINRAQIQPFPFATLSRPPLVVLRSVRIVQINANGNIRGKAVFDLQGAVMNDETSFDYEFKVRNGSVGSGYGSGDLTPQTPTRRVREWIAYKDLGRSPGQKQMTYVSGRVSAEERWPLAFEFDPFDYDCAKAGQELGFRAWPAPIPKP